MEPFGKETSSSSAAEMGQPAENCLPKNEDDESQHVTTSHNLPKGSVPQKLANLMCDIHVQLVTSFLEKSP